MKKKICKECGGTIHGKVCKLCELFQDGFTVYAGVEQERMNNPKLSDPLGVSPRQVKEAMASSRRKGVPTDFTKDGRAIITSRAHQKKYLRAYGFHNRDGGYGD